MRGASGSRSLRSKLISAAWCLVMADSPHSLPGGPDAAISSNVCGGAPSALS